jgi:hypothetical protein
MENEGKAWKGRYPEGKEDMEVALGGGEWKRARKRKGGSEASACVCVPRERQNYCTVLYDKV